MSVTLFVDHLWISPYAYTAFVALEEKGVAYEVQTVSLADGQQRAERYLDVSLTGRIPALVHDGFGLAESSAITEYVEEVFPGPRLFPEDPKERARARQIMSWLRSDLLALREERPTTTMFYERATKPLSARAALSASKLVAVADALLRREVQLTIGPSWSIADADLGFMLHRLVLNNDPVPSHVRRYAEAQWSRPSAMKWVAVDRPPASAQ
ncbi:MAG: glutathione transferase [Myxococcota bacterium]